MRSSQSALTDDHRWLVSDDADRWLRTAAMDLNNPFALTKRLRKDLTAERVHLVVQQADLRRRAEAKFTRASEMFFSPLGLEQSTDEVIATYKAGRLAEALAPAEPTHVVDLCCGIGGDMLALSRYTHVTAVDRDPVAHLFAEANAERLCQERCQVKRAPLGCRRMILLHE